jgi:arylsulfatase A-like enzyme
MFDGGTRVPFLVSWPGHVTPGESDALVSHLDFYASFAAMTDQRLKDGEAPDSLDMYETLLGKSGKGRDEFVVEGIQAKTVLRQNEWVFIPPHDGPAVNVNTNTELGNAPEAQLFNLCMDIGQIKNVAVEHGEIVARMSARLEGILAGKQTRLH